MEQNVNSERLIWVTGNTLTIAVPLTTKTAIDGQWVDNDYYPPEGSEIKVFIVGSYKRYEYDYTLDGNVVRITDKGTLPVGTYGLEITIKEPSEAKRRTFKCKQIKVCNCTEDIGILPDGEILLDAAIFVQGEKGEQGPPGTTDYNELANKPDLSVYMLGITQEQFDEIFT